MPMPAEYHESHSHHENANFALGGYQDSSNMTANMYRVGGELLSLLLSPFCIILWISLHMIRVKNNQIAIQFNTRERDLRMF